MALKECKKCNKKVSSSADVCPSCGVIDPTKWFKISEIPKMIRVFLALMRKRRCKDCNSEITTHKKPCSNCGSKYPTTTFSGVMLRGATTFIVFVLCLVVLFPDKKPQEAGVIQLSKGTVVQQDEASVKDTVKNQPTQYPKKESNDTICKRLDSSLYKACMIQLMGK